MKPELCEMAEAHQDFWADLEITGLLRRASVRNGGSLQNLGGCCSKRWG
jgi:hypothetical protein